MFCFQCEQTFKGQGCTTEGVCGKNEKTAVLQDLLVHAAKGIAMYAHCAAKLGARDPDVDRCMMESLFATVTNVDFDPLRLEDHLHKAAAMRDKARTIYEAACRKAGKPAESLSGTAAWTPADDLDGLVRQGAEVSILQRQTLFGADVAGLAELVLYGLKGAAAYADHAYALGREDPAIYAAFHEALDFLAEDGHTADELLARRSRRES